VRSSGSLIRCLYAGADPNQHEPGMPAPLEIARMWHYDRLVRLLLGRRAQQYAEPAPVAARKAGDH